MPNPLSRGSGAGQSSGEVTTIKKDEVIVGRVRDYYCAKGLKWKSPSGGSNAVEKVSGGVSVAAPPRRNLR